MAAAEQDGVADDGVALADTVVPQPAEGEGSERSGGAAPQEQEPASGEMAGLQLDHFRLEQPLGKGGMGTVYAAHDLSLDRRVAIKMLRGDLGKPKHQERLLREARAQARLKHPNVVHIYYIGKRPDTDALFLAMEHIEGEAFDAIAESGRRLPPEEARRAMLQVARGLRAARRAGVIHRDIKPSNLIRDRDGEVKIADFGLAKPVEAEVARGAAEDTARRPAAGGGGDPKLTEEGAVVGSPRYMAPEQARGEQVDHRTDMYALGATFFHLSTGQPPYRGDSAPAVIQQHLSSEVPSVRERAPEVPAELARIVEQLMAKDRERRFADYDQLIEALERAAPQATHYAGFWIRAAAMLVDVLVAAGLIALLGWWGSLVHLLHVTVGHAGRGQTVAKYLLKLRVRRLDGERLGLGRSVVRTVVSLWMPFLAAVTVALSQGFPRLQSTIERIRPNEVGQLQDLVLAVAISNGFMSLLYAAGLALAAFHPHKRALHDLAVGSIVTYSLPGARSRGTGE